MTPHPQQDDHIDDLDRLAGWIRFQIENRQAHNAFCKESRRTYRKVLKQIDAVHLERTRCCASHSTAPTEQSIRQDAVNKVLDKVIEYMVTKGGFTVHKNASPAGMNVYTSEKRFYFSDFYEWINELRKQEQP